MSAVNEDYVTVPKTLLKPLKVPHKKLMGPGPSNCSPRVLLALSLPVLGHLHPECTQIMDEIKAGLQYVFQTKNPYTLAISASGHAGMEMSLSNLIEPGDVVLVTKVGIWGQRAADMATRYGADVRILENEAGKNIRFQDLEKAITVHKPVLVFMVQGESSTGVYQPLEGIGALCHRYNSLLVVDTVASLGGVPMRTDEWEIDVIYSGSQKYWVPHLDWHLYHLVKEHWSTAKSVKAIFVEHGKCLSVSRKKIYSRKTPSKVFYWDLEPLANYWGCTSDLRYYHHTISSTLLYALREGLALIAEEGIEKCITRHMECAKRFHKGLVSLGLELFVEDKQARLPTVTTVKVPHNINLKEIQNYAMDRHLLEISGGLGPTAGRVFRIGLMGYNATNKNVDHTLRVIKEALDHARKSNLNAKL